jgi:hypothetical protein
VADDLLVHTGMALVTLTSAAAAYRAFVAVCYSTLLLLFIRLRAYERLPRWDADGRARLRREVWALST